MTRALTPRALWLLAGTATLALGGCGEEKFDVSSQIGPNPKLPAQQQYLFPPMKLASIVGVVLRGQDNNILTQVGFIVLIGLAAKNAILIVEFAKQLQDQGRSRWEAAVEAAQLRLRPILMTSLAFIFGVVPLVWATGAGAELRQTLGTAMFSGMIGVTVFGLIFTPVFYVVSRWLAERLKWRRKPAAHQPAE